MGMGGGGKSPFDQSGLTQFDTAAVSQAMGQNIRALDNRYRQLGLGVPGGDPAQAAASGTNLPWAGKSTANIQDDQGQVLQGNALLGQIANQNLPAAAAANAANSSNLGSALGSLASLAGGAGFL